MNQAIFDQHPSAILSTPNGVQVFKICTTKFAYPDADNVYDADWHWNYLSFTLPAFKAEIEDVILDGQMLQICITELEALTSFRSKKAEIAPNEPYFELEFTLKRKKRVKVNGYVQYPAGYGATLDFEFITDLTSIVTFLSGLKEILEHFPPAETRGFS